MTHNLYCATWDSANSGIVPSNYVVKSNTNTNEAYSIPSYLPYTSREVCLDGGSRYIYKANNVSKPSPHQPSLSLQKTSLPQLRFLAPHPPKLIGWCPLFFTCYATFPKS